MQEREPSLASRRYYVQRVLDLYRHAPGTSGRLLRCDRQLAGQLFDRGVSIDVVQAAVILAVARRTFRPNSAPPLPPIATLHYFRPVINELIAFPPEPGYIDYVRYKLATVAPELVTALDHQLP